MSMNLSGIPEIFLGLSNEFERNSKHFGWMSRVSGVSLGE